MEYISNKLRGIQPPPLGAGGYVRVKPTLQLKSQYRICTVGRALKKTLDTMVMEGKLREQTIENVFIHFDVCIAERLTRAVPRLLFSVTEVPLFKEVDYVYTCLLKNPIFRVQGRMARDNFFMAEPGRNVRLDIYPRRPLNKY